MNSFILSIINPEEVHHEAYYNDLGVLALLRSPF